MTLTVEPGIYFIDKLIEETKGNDLKIYMNYENIAEYRDVIGGVRIEDCIVITVDGYDNYTECPRTIEEIEKCMAGDNWKD